MKRDFIKPEIKTPALLLDEHICKANIRRMAKKAKKFELHFKPHMKTHQSAIIGKWFEEAGVSAITVSSVSMAKYFSNHGWNDITIAFPVNIRQIKEINELAGSIKLTLLVTNSYTIHLLDQKLSNNLNVYVELDTGGHRSGLKPSNLAEIENLIDILERTKNLTWIGFYSHSGHSYQARSKEEIEKIHYSVHAQFKKIKANLTQKYGSFQICSGDTPCCSIGDNFEQIDAISPGNFVFYDIMQHQIGSCDIQDIAVAMVCPIVDKYPNREELIIYGGAIHFSKESLGTSHQMYGLPCYREKGCWRPFENETYLKSLSQEHGIVRCTPKTFDEFKIGETITILPVHSCLTAHLMGSFILAGGRKIKQLA